MTRALTNDAAQVIIIDVKAMDQGQGFDIIYYSDIPSVADGSVTDTTPFIVQTDTDRDADSDLVSIPIGNNATGDPTIATGVSSPGGLVDHGTADYVTGGRLRRKDGSGTMMITDMYVQHDSTTPLKEFTLTYKAATNLRNAELSITVPVELLGHDGVDDVPDFSLQPIELHKGETDGRKSREAGYVYTTDSHAKPENDDNPELTVTTNTITWHALIRWHINSGQTFTTKIRVNTEGTAHNATTAAAATTGTAAGDIRDPADGVTGDRDVLDDGVYPFYTTLDAGSPLFDAIALETDSDADLYAVRGKSIDVTFHVVEGAVPSTATVAGVPGAPEDHVTYTAASTENITFRFRAESTSIKGGSVSFKMPSAAGWTTPALPADPATNPGRLTAKQYNSDGDYTVAPAVFTDLKEEISAGRTVTITVDALPKGGFIDITYMAADVQYTADTVDIIANFKTSPKDRTQNKAGRVEVEVINVADGSGSATISTGTSPAHTVRAGSTDNKITITFTTPGTMSGGQVAVEIPDGWGDMQDRSADDPNHIKVEAGNGGTLSSANPSHVGRNAVIANLEEFQKGDTVKFTYTNAEAPSELGIGAFVVSSAGDRDGSLSLLIGDAKQPADKEEAELLGEIFWEEESDPSNDTFELGTDMANGELRISVISAADGTGEAIVEIRESSSAPGKYDGSDVETQEVHAGDTAVYLLFTYTPHETITNGELRFTVPSDWTPPQEDDQGEAGYTYFEDVRGAATGSPDIPGDSRTITVEIIEMTKDDAVQIHYGWHGVREGGAEAPDDASPGDTFGFQIKGSEKGDPQSLRSGSPKVKVREAASGSGTAAISPSSADAADMETITITYTAAGEIEDGTLRLEVPDWSDASSDNITVRGGGGSADHGRGYYEYDEDGETLVAKADKPDHTPSLLQVVYSSISLNAGGTVVFTYNTQVGATIGNHDFKLAFKGGEGPGLDAEDPTVGFGTDIVLMVSVGEAAAGTGELDVIGADGITASSEDDKTATEISFVYIAEGEIDYPGEFAVRVPTAWAEDGPTASDYEVEYQNADGDVLRGTSQSVEEDAPDGQDMMARIRGASSPRISAEHRIVFTYTSDAPETAGPYDFTVFYDDEKVGDITVNVLSAEEATTVELSSTETEVLDGTDTPVAITISLVDDTGTAATMSSSFSVGLSSDVSTGMFSNAADGTYAATLTVLIAAGQTEMTVYYQDASGDAATVTATSGLPDATVDIATDVLKIVAGSASATITDSDGIEKSAAALGDTVTVSAMANGAPKFKIGGHADVSMTETATAGTYSGTWSPVSDLHDGTHTVTVTLGATSANAGQITVDTKDPSVTVTAPAAGMTVLNSATITISATVTDTTDVTVTADVSALDSGATGSVTLTDGTGTHMITEKNTNDNGEYTITVTATDAAGNTGTGEVAVMLDNTRSFTSMIPDAVSLFHVPLDVDGMDTVGDLKAALGEAVLQVIVHRGGSDYNADSDSTAITGDLGLILVTNGAIEHEFVGRPWGGGTATISVSTDGNTLIGVPVDSGDMMISDIIGLFPEGVVAAIITAAGDNKYPRIDGPNDPDDAAVEGDAAYLAVVTGDGTATVSGAGWSNGGSAGAAPIALSGYQLDTQTPVVSVYGSVVDEITGLAKEGFRAKVKNLTTKAALSSIISVEATDGFNMTFVDLTDAHAARVGDVLEISADSPDPLVGVKPVRHIVTVDDVKNTRIQLEDLIAYEIPAETELLRNYPNPFNPETWIPYHLSEDADVNLTIYGINGEVVRDIDVGHQTAAKYDTRAKAIYWDGRNRFGEQVASGIYFYHLDAGDFSGTRKMVILK